MCSEFAIHTVLTFLQHHNLIKKVYTRKCCTETEFIRQKDEANERSLQIINNYYYKAVRVTL